VGHPLTLFVIFTFDMDLSSEFRARSDQFDIRLNVDSNGRLDEILSICNRLYATENVRYLHCSNVEIGDVPTRGSFGKRHVHLALCFYNARTVMSIIKKFNCHGSPDSWYIVPRNKKLPLDGWLRYHAKSRTKIQALPEFLFQEGVLPASRSGHTTPSVSTASSVASNRQQERHEQWKRREYLVKMHDYETLDIEFPGFQYGSAFRMMNAKFNKQSNRFVKPLDGPLNNYIIWGDSGTGKSSSIALLYPECYKKQKGSSFWDGYDIHNPNHSIVWIDEMSVETLKCFSGKIDGGFEFLKELADRYPVTVDEKYQVAFKIRPKSILITMNEHPTSLLPDRAVEVNKRALYRKFRIMHVSDWLEFHCLENTPNGVRHLPIFESDTEIAGEYEFNKQQAKRIKRTSSSIHRRDSGIQEKAKGSISYLLSE
jgi:hypothetical protein